METNMEAELRAELLVMRSFLLLTLAEVANHRPDPDAFLEGAQDEIVRSLSNLRVEPEAFQGMLRARAVEMALDWFTHIHMKSGDEPTPY
jgi:hypothetical protein